MNHKKKVSKMRVAFIIHCLVLPLLTFAVFYVYVNFDSIVMAFMNRDKQWTLENFTRFFKEVSESGTDFNTALKNTALTFVINLATYPLKVLVSYFIYKKVPFYGVYRVLFFLPNIIFAVAQTMVVARILAPTSPISDIVASLFNLEYTPELLADSRFANATVLIHMLWGAFPGDLIIWGGTFARIPTDVLESGQIDGVNWWQEFTKIIVPLVWPTVSLQMILMTCGIFSASGSVFLLTAGEYGTETINSWQYKILLRHTGLYETSNIYNYLSAAGLVMSVIAITLSIVIRKYVDKAFDEVDF